jgi:hypothetical protein
MMLKSIFVQTCKLQWEKETQDEKKQNVVSAAVRVTHFEDQIDPWDCPTLTNKETSIQSNTVKVSQVNRLAESLACKWQDNHQPCCGPLLHAKQSGFKNSSLKVTMGASDPAICAKACTRRARKLRQASSNQKAKQPEMETRQHAAIRATEAKGIKTKPKRWSGQALKWPSVQASE